MSIAVGSTVIPLAFWQQALNTSCANHPMMGCGVMVDSSGVGVNLSFQQVAMPRAGARRQLHIDL